MEQNNALSYEQKAALELQETTGGVGANSELLDRRVAPIIDRKLWRQNEKPLPMGGRAIFYKTNKATSDAFRDAMAIRREDAVASIQRQKAGSDNIHHYLIRSGKRRAIHVVISSTALQLHGLESLMLAAEIAHTRGWKHALVFDSSTAGSDACTLAVMNRDAYIARVNLKK